MYGRKLHHDHVPLRLFLQITIATTPATIHQADTSNTNAMKINTLVTVASLAAFASAAPVLLPLQNEKQQGQEQQGLVLTVSNAISSLSNMVSVALGMDEKKDEVKEHAKEHAKEHRKKKGCHDRNAKGMRMGRHRGRGRGRGRGRHHMKEVVEEEKEQKKRKHHKRPAKDSKAESDSDSDFDSDDEDVADVQFDTSALL